MLTQLFAIIIFVVIALAESTSMIMRAIKVGHHPILSPIIGAASGIGILLISTDAMIVAMIAAAVVTVLADIVIERIVGSAPAAKVDDKAHEAVDVTLAKLDTKIDAAFARADDRQYQRLLTSPSADERVKGLWRHIYEKMYAFSLTGDMERTYGSILQRIEETGLDKAEPGTRLEYGDTKAGNKVINFYIPMGDARMKSPIRISIMFYQQKGAVRVELYLSQCDDQGIPNGDIVRFKKGLSYKMDRIYMFLSAELKRLDSACSVTIAAKEA